MQEWSLAEIAAVQNDLSAPVNKLTAAAQWLNAATGNGCSTDRIINNTAGAPGQDVNVNVKHEHSVTIDYDAIEDQLKRIGTGQNRRLAHAVPANGN
jgi:hypothetical protein